MVTTRFVEGRTLAALLCGCLLGGVCTGFSFGPQAMGLGAGLLPAIIFGVAAFMLPALYIGGAFLGTAPPLSAFVKAAWHSLGDLGVVMCGLAPAALFLLATSRSTAVPFIISGLLVAGGAVVGVRAFRARLEALSSAKLGFDVMYLAWALVALGIGWHLFRRLLTLLAA